MSNMFITNGSFSTMKSFNITLQAYYDVLCTAYFLQQAVHCKSDCAEI